MPDTLASTNRDGHCVCLTPTSAPRRVSPCTNLNLIDTSQRVARLITGARNILGNQVSFFFSILTR